MLQTGPVSVYFATLFFFRHSTQFFFVSLHDLQILSFRSLYFLTAVSVLHSAQMPIMITPSLFVNEHASCLSYLLVCVNKKITLMSDVMFA